MGFPGAARGKESTCWCRRWFTFNPLVEKIPLEEEMASHSSNFAWTIPCAEERDGLLSMRLQSQTWLSDWAHTHKYNSLKLKIKRSRAPTSDMAVWVASQICFSKTTCNSCIFIERTDEAETPILWPPDVKSWLIEKDLMLGKLEGRRKRGQQRMRCLVGITDSMDMSLNKLWGIV